ncbi:Sensory box/GGDEF domain protein [hydrothermal vent metagenome]|uniref:Sensory box/GGDEF domain protein n=1 Tax=hydrothermal vent metagenome TaxID=652676 RepID=A0A1W1D492_9ZZZZ
MKLSIKQRIMFFITLMFLIANGYIISQEYFGVKKSIYEHAQSKYHLARNLIEKKIEQNTQIYLKKAEFIISVNGVAQAVAQKDAKNIIQKLGKIPQRLFHISPLANSFTFYDNSHKSLVKFDRSGISYPKTTDIKNRILNFGIVKHHNTLTLNVYKDIYYNGDRVGVLVFDIRIHQIFQTLSKYIDNLSLFIYDKKNIFYGTLAQKKENAHLFVVEDKNLLLDAKEQLVAIIKFQFDISKDLLEHNEATIKKIGIYFIGFILVLFILNLTLNHYLNIINNYKNKAQAVLDTQPNPIIALRHNKLVQINKAFEDVFEINSITEFYERYGSLTNIFISTQKIFSIADDKSWCEYLKLHRKTMISVKTTHDHEYTYELYSKKLSLESDTIVVTFQDVTELFKESKTNYDLAHIDELTGIYNRKFLNKTLEEMLDKGEPFSLLMLDIDHFKDVNDTYGHDIGDEILKALTRTVQHSIREKDIFCRWGGEEFMIILKDAYIDSIELIAEKIRKNIENMEIENLPKITASFGGTIYLPDDSSYTMIKRADNALYESKETGRNKVTIG